MTRWIQGYVEVIKNWIRTCQSLGPREKWNRRGIATLPPAPVFPFIQLGSPDVNREQPVGPVMSRREFIVLGGTAAAVLALLPLSGCGGGSSNTSSTSNDQSLYVYRLSSRGKRTSQAAKKHNANKLFATWDAAESNRAHPGDRSRIVQVNISPARYERLFLKPNRDLVDLRSVNRSL
jgi:hypothetical protein